MDFNGTYFSHPKADDGFTLSSANKAIRKFWIEHGIACRRIGAYMGKQLGTPCVTNTWIPDGYKDVPADRKGPRERLKESLDEILLHVSRGVRWDSDHVVVLSDELQALAQELVRGDYLDRVHIGLDFFDASINRIAAWVIGTRCMIKALLIALLEPTRTLRRLEAGGDHTARLAMLEELKTLPFGAVWDSYCMRSNVPAGDAWLAEVKAYEKNVLSVRS